MEHLNKIKEDLLGALITLGENSLSNEQKLEECDKIILETLEFVDTLIQNKNYYRKKDHISRFKNGEERYRNLPIAHSVIEYLIRDAEPHHIIDNLCIIIDEQQKMIERISKNRPNLIKLKKEEWNTKVII